MRQILKVLLKEQVTAKRTTRNKKNRKRNISWFQLPPPLPPSWNSNVKTNLGKKFLSIVDKCFPKKKPLNKIFNRHTLKLAIIHANHQHATSHNKQILSNVATTPIQKPDSCNCRKKSECPLEGKCLQENVVYQAMVTTETTTESYVGLATNFKEQ